MKRSKTTVEVNQSIKIGDLSGATVLAFSDHVSWTVLIPAGVKRALMVQLRARGKSRIRAAVQMGRHYVGYELSAEYCALAEKRLASLAGE